MHQGRLEGRTAIVTGAGAAGDGIGNGRAIAMRLAREGALVLAVDREPSLVERTQDMLRSEGADCAIFVADVSIGAQVREMVQAATALTGRIDVIVNNVGIGVYGGPMELAEEDWDRVFAVNVKSMFLTAKYVLPVMLEQGKGSMVNVSSVASIRSGPPPLLAYNASKAAVNALTQTIALEYAARGIRANAILPGLINTPMVRKPLSHTGNDVEAAIAARGAICPTGAMGTGWDVASAALFLASDDASYINGVLLPVDGGLTQQVIAPAAKAN